MTHPNLSTLLSEIERLRLIGFLPLREGWLGDGKRAQTKTLDSFTVTVERCLRKNLDGSYSYQWEIDLRTEMPFLAIRPGIGGRCSSAVEAGIAALTALVRLQAELIDRAEKKQNAT